MFVVWLFLIAMALVFLETTVFNSLAVHGVKPDLLLIYVIFIGWRKGTVWGQSTGFLCGLLDDLLQGGLFGSQVLAKTLTGYFSGLGAKRLFYNKLPLQGIVIFSFSLFNNLWLFIIGLLFNYPCPFPVITGYVYNTLVALPIFWLLNKLDGGPDE